MRSTTARIFLCAVLLLTAGCQRTIDNVTLSARNPSGLAIWTSHASNDFPSEISAEIRDALTEFKLAIMRRGEATGSAAVEQQLCAYVNELTVRALLIQARELKEERMQIERNLYQQHYASLLAGYAHPGDTQAENKLRFYRDAAKTRLDKLNTDLSANAKRLVELRDAAPKP